MGKNSPDDFEIINHREGTPTPPSPLNDWVDWMDVTQVSSTEENMSSMDGSSDKEQHRKTDGQGHTHAIKEGGDSAQPPLAIRPKPAARSEPMLIHGMEPFPPPVVPARRRFSLESDDGLTGGAQSNPNPSDNSKNAKDRNNATTPRHQPGRPFQTPKRIRFKKLPDREEDGEQRTPSPAESDDKDTVGETKGKAPEALSPSQPARNTAADKATDKALGTREQAVQAARSARWGGYGTFIERQKARDRERGERLEQKRREELEKANHGN